MPQTSLLAKLQLFPIAQFAGINQRLPKFLIANEQAQDILNFVFDDRGALTKIAGYTQFSTSSLGASTMLGGERFYKAGVTPHFVEAHNGSIYKYDSVGGTTSLISGLSTTAKWAMKMDRDLLFMVNGSDENKKYNGTAVTKMGLTAPTAALTAAAGAVGNPNGAYTWKYTYVSPTMESNGSPVSNSVNLVSQQANLTGITVSADTQVTARRIYRTLAGGSDWKFVGQINDNTTTIFTDNIADSGLGADVPTGKDVPPICKYIEAAKKRIWLAGDPNNPRRVYFSELFEPEAFPVNNYVDVPLAPGDEVTAIKALGESIVVYGHNTPVLLIGDSAFEIVARRSFALHGTESSRTVISVENVHMCLSRFGWYAFDGTTSRLLSDDIDPLIQDINQVYILNAAAAYHEKRKWVRLSVTSTTEGGTTNNRELMLDTRIWGWTKTDRKIAYYHHLDGPGDKGELFTASPTAGLLNQEDVGNSANGANITCRWRSKAYTLGPIDWTKFLRFLLVWGEPLVESLHIETKMDDSAEKTQSFAASTGSLALYGTAVYGTSVYSGPVISRLNYVYHQKMNGRYVELYMETATDEAVKIYSLEIAYRAHDHLRVR